MTRVAGVDSSTQGCKVTVRDLATGRELRSGTAAHPAATIVDPEVWWDALLLAVARAGGLEDVSAISVSGQQHTPVFLDSRGRPVCDSPLWNDTSSHQQVEDLNDELGREEWIRRTGLPLTVSDTVVKVRWLRDRDPEAARAVAAVAVVHDWLTWRLLGHGPGSGDVGSITTDRSEASGTAYWSGETEDYCWDLLELALGRRVELPAVLAPLERAGLTAAGIPGIPASIAVGAGSGDNAAAALALEIGPGDAVLSIGTSGVVYAVSEAPVHDYEGYVCSYADAAGAHLPLVATLNAARNLDVGSRVLGCTHEELSDLALRARPGAEGLTLLPFFEGERTPDVPWARGAVLEATLANFTRENMARAFVEGTIASQMVMLDALQSHGVEVDRLLLIGGASRSQAVRQVLSEVVAVPVALPDAEEFVARGAATQAAGALTGSFPRWGSRTSPVAVADQHPEIRQQHSAAKSALGYEARSRSSASTSG